MWECKILQYSDSWVVHKLSNAQNITYVIFVYTINCNCIPFHMQAFFPFTSLFIQPNFCNWKKIKSKLMDMKVALSVGNELFSGS